MRAFIGLGSNLGDREDMLLQALDRLGRSHSVSLVRVSQFRETDPVGEIEQPRFLNAVAEVTTDLTPSGLLELLQQIEDGLGRDRLAPRFGPRTVDLDLLLYGEEVVDQPGLVVPHPRLYERRFVLEPLAELEPELVLPDGRRIAELLASELQ